jgi:hypothetical protein
VSQNGKLLLSGFAHYGWALYSVRGRARLSFGCEDRPLTAWTRTLQEHLLTEHDDRPAVRSALRIVVAAARAAWRARK